MPIAIPLLDLKLQHQEIRAEIDRAVNDCINEGNFIKGQNVAGFERAFADYLKAEFCISCGNGTDALEIILKSLGIGPGDEVIVPALTWIATAEAVNNVGAEPVFADILERSFTIDPDSAEKKISSKTKAVIAVHLYGCPAEMDQLRELASVHGIFLIEDCAQSHGAEYKGAKTGTFGIAAAFSFFPSKNLGAFGDAGAIITNDNELADRARMIANHGQLEKRHNHLIVGRNSRLDSLQAAVLKVKLPFLDQWNEKRIALAHAYREQLIRAEMLTLPSVPDNMKHVFHLFVIRSRRRDLLMQYLENNNIGCGIHYPSALPFMEAYRYKHHSKSEFPVAGNASAGVLSIPMYPGMTGEQLARVSDSIVSFRGEL
ncbi:MAG: DegT/DnrJ/EryC1/StrS family aminotransferase [Bacteroidales bacterium]|jgi:dTDP-4-amino-4,6-dideoxygalactose transaminase|nr:DegT/DnrJ/EryC1/StrS family aminotransferase [Bacteroidales bacterium]